MRLSDLDPMARLRELAEAKRKLKRKPLQSEKDYLAERQRNMDAIDYQLDKLLSQRRQPSG